MSELILQVKNLSLALQGKPILHDIELNIEQGVFFAILGINGSGKTTLLRALNARLPLSSGKISYLGADVSSNEALRAISFGFAPPISQLPFGLSCGELIGLLAELRGCIADENDLFYKALGIGTLKDVFIERMSSGMKQRLSVYCAVLSSPKLLLLDEPFNWLDPIACFELKQALKVYISQGNSALIALHDVQTFMSQADQGLLLHQGKISRLFSNADLIKGRKNIEAFESEIFRGFKQA